MVRPLAALILVALTSTAAWAPFYAWPRTIPTLDLTRPAPSPAQVKARAVRAASKRYDIPPALINAVIDIESGGSARAVSGKGARGLMQLMPATAVSMKVADVEDVTQNIMGGTRYLYKLMKRFDGDIALTLAAYNAGPENVVKYGGVPPFEETQQYVMKVMDAYLTYKGRE
jgi:soluble lytic murein transglycosylase-like protein